jgi:putative CocE/NonD family hydrolase
MIQKMLPSLYCRYYRSNGVKRLYAGIIFLLFPFAALKAQSYKEDSAFMRDNYVKRELHIPMRDGNSLFTVIYLPADSGTKYPFLMVRTPYSVAPYGADKFPYRLGPNNGLMREKYIFVYQDVRGRYMSEGEFEEMTPHRNVKKTVKETDESSDTFDTIEWLLKNIANNNGRVGVWGISYPGFYASASIPEAHPAIKAVSPQAPVTDEFIGDDANHKGAFFLMDNFGFMNYFDAPRKGPVEDYGDGIFKVNYKDAYQFFLQMGPVSNSNSSTYFNNRSKIWNEYLAHDTYDAYWKARNIRPHFKQVKSAVLVVGGWFDAENLFGALETYRAIEKNNPANNNRLVMGPWTHGAWSSGNWSQYATHDFKQNTSRFYQEEIETPFFNYYLKDKGQLSLPEAYVFETGKYEWQKYAQWPPANMQPVHYYLGKNGILSTNGKTNAGGYTEYNSDPARPVPYTNLISRGRNNEYMAEDQRFASRRPDVTVFVTDTLTADITLAGPVAADLFVSTTGTDADFIVKLIDVLPEHTSNPSPNPRQVQMGGMERLVRAEVIRGKFRNSFEKPVPFTPGKISEVKFTLPDVAHTFLKGHRIMVQVQSSWFPLVDRNPQKFIQIPKAKESDFIKSGIRIYHEPGKESKIILPVLK